MAERLPGPMRLSGVRTIVLVATLVGGVLLAGCGNGSPVAVGPGQSSTACPSTGTGTTEVARADLDGDGSLEAIDYQPSTAQCAALLTAVVGGRASSVTLDDDLPIAARASFAIGVPGRTGDIAVLREEHPRGGFQVILFAWSAGAGVTTLNVDGEPIFPFVATDVLTDPLSARCVDNGFEVSRARAHTPIGVVPAWDIFQTTYTINGTTVTKSATTEVADNVLDKDLHRQYADLVRYKLFGNCRVTSAS